MPDAELLNRFQNCVRYQEARWWQKPWLNPRRFFGNQLRKHRIVRRETGSLHRARTFHLPRFTLVQGELVSEQLIGYGVYEPELTETFLHLVKPGQVVLDVGMHLGYYATLFATLVGKTGQVHAFEPTPSTREIGMHNTAQFPQICVHSLALWSNSQEVLLQDYGCKWMAFNSLKNARLDREPTSPREIRVQAVTLDEFRASLNRPITLMKIDAESAEREIIRGGHELLRKDRPLVSLEVGDTCNSDESRSLLRDMAALDYEPWERRAGRFCRHTERASYAYGNLIFAPAARDLGQEAEG